MGADAERRAKIDGAFAESRRELRTRHRGHARLLGERQFRLMRRLQLRILRVLRLHAIDSRLKSSQLLFYLSGTVLALIFSILSVEAKLLHS